MAPDRKSRRTVRIEKVIRKADPTLVFDYKDPASLSRFVTERGRLLSQEKTGLTSKQQDALTKAVKRARMLALLPFAN
jgi:small subunit ribosomal protein S18